MIICLPPNAERELLRICVHEAGHELVSAWFRLRPRTFVAGPSCGICVFARGTAGQAAAVAWAGVLAEDLTGFRPERRALPRAALSRATVERWYSEATSAEGLAQLSPDDREKIADCPTSFEAFMAAFNILDAYDTELRLAANRLADESRDRFSAALHRADPWADEADIARFSKLETNRLRIMAAEI